MFDFKLTTHKIFESYWAQLMMYNLMHSGTSTDSAYICSPLRAETRHGFEMNMSAVKAYMCYVFVKMGLNPQAPHAFLPYFLDDTDPAERQLALEVGLTMLKKCSVLLVCGNRISTGMRGEIEEAARLGKEIRVFSEDIVNDIKTIVNSVSNRKSQAELDKMHTYLSLPAEDIIPTDQKGATNVM